MLHATRKLGQPATFHGFLGRTGSRSTSCIARRYSRWLCTHRSQPPCSVAVVAPHRTGRRSMSWTARRYRSWCARCATSGSPWAPAASPAAWTLVRACVCCLVLSTAVPVLAAAAACACAPLAFEPIEGVGGVHFPFTLQAPTRASSAASLMMTWPSSRTTATSECLRLACAAAPPYACLVCSPSHHLAKPLLLSSCLQRGRLS